MKTKRHRWLVGVLSVFLSVFFVLIINGSTARAQVILDEINLGVDVGGIAVNPNTNLVYVAVTGQLRVYNAQTHALVTTIPLPQNYVPCYDVAINTVTNRIYAVGFRTYVIDSNTNAVLGNFDKTGKEIAINPTTNRIYIATIVNYPYTDPYVIRVLDGANNTWLPDINLGTINSYESIYLAVNPITNRVYITFTGDNNLRVLDGNSHAELTRLSMSNIGSVAMDSVTNRVYVGINYTDAAVLDGANHTQVGTIVDIGMGRLLLNLSTNRIYSVNYASPGYVLRIADTTTYKLVGYVHLDGDLADYDIHPQLGKLFATHDMYPSSWGKKMTIIQDDSPTGPAPTPTPPARLATIELPEKGYSVAVNQQTNRVYVGMDGSLAVFDATTLALLNTFDVDSNPDFPPIDDISIDETRNRIYAVSTNKTYVIDGTNDQVVSSLGSGDEIAINPNNGRVYIVDEAVWLGDPDRLKIYDGVNMTLIRTIDLGTSNYFQSGEVAVNPTTGYAYVTYSLDDDLRIISPTTDDVMQKIDYTSIGDVTVNPITNRVFVWISREGKSGALILDGNTHNELGMVDGVSGQLEIDPQINRLYGYTGYTLFQAFDVASDTIVSRVFLDGTIRKYAIFPNLMRLYAIHADYPEWWGKKMSVIQDAVTPLPPPPTKIRINLPIVIK